MWRALGVEPLPGQLRCILRRYDDVGIDQQFDGTGSGLLIQHHDHSHCRCRGSPCWQLPQDCEHSFPGNLCDEGLKERVAAGEHLLW